MNPKILDNDFIALSPIRELASYEALWDKEGSTVKTVSEQFKTHNFQKNPSSLLNNEIIEEYIQKLKNFLSPKPSFEIALFGETDFPLELFKTTHPLPLIYYKGAWDLIYTSCVSVVGTREATEDGIRRTKRLVKCLIEDKYTIVSGLAKGIDTIAHETAISLKGKTIGVIGTPINEYYPKENKSLQDVIAKDYLLLSQVPFLKYNNQDFRQNRYFFPERNKIMASLSIATIIVEAGKTSGSLIQAREALKLGRKVFILDSCFNISDLDWPEKFVAKGAIRVKDYIDIKKALSDD